MFVNGSKLNEQSLLRTFQGYASYQISIHLAKRFQRRIFMNQPIRNKNCLWQPCLLTFRDEISNLYRGLSIDASYQVSVHLNNQFQRFLEIDKSEKRVACGGHACQRIMTFHRCFLLNFGSFGKAVSEEKIFRNRPITKTNCLWWPCLLTNRDNISNLYRGPSKDASYQISVQLAKQFQRRRFLYARLETGRIM